MKKIIISFLILSFSISLVFSEPLGAKWYTSSLDVSVGEEIVVNLYVTPDETHPVYTISNTLMYDPEMLEFVRAEFDEDWFVLSQEPNFLTDTVAGMIRRTGGVAKGVNFEKKYLTYIFKAKSIGPTKISLEDGSAYDAENTNIGLQNKEMSLNITEAVVEEVVEDEPVETEVVVQKQINLNFDLWIKSAVRAGEDYNLVVPLDPSLIADNSGQVSIVLLDNLREVVYKNAISFEKNNTKKMLFVIPGFKLMPGDYFLDVKTVYNESGKVFRVEKQLGVLPSDRTWADVHKYEILSLFFIVVLIALIHHLHTEHDFFRKLGRRKI